MTAEFHQTAVGRWFWVVVKNKAWFVVGQATYRRRSDAKRALERFMASSIGGA